MNCLGIESTAHTFGSSVVSFDGKILSNVKDQFTTTEGGMIPVKVAEHHKLVKDNIIAEALKQANVSWEQIDLISYSGSPGLAPCLLVGLETAKKLAKENNKEIINANHAIAHLTIGQLCTGAKDPVYLYVSGPNTQVIALAGKKFRVFGETLDIGLGNALDKFGREAGLGFPAGPKIEELAKKGKYSELPYAVKGMDVSFAGIITKAMRMLKEGTPLEDLCFSLQETCFAMLAEVAERALAHCEKKELLLIGGVAANQRLCNMLDIMCKEREAKFYPVPLKYSGDQAAMIAWQGILEYKAGRRLRLDEADINPYERTDEVEAIRT